MTFAFPGIGTMSGIHMDRDDNLYVLSAACRVEGGRTWFNDTTCTLIKVRPGKARVLAARAVIPLGEAARPARSPDLEKGDLGRASDYATGSLDFNRMNIEGYQVAAVAERLRGSRDAALSALGKIAALDPLNHFVRFERHLLRADEKSRQEFVAGIRNELPQETYLELAIWYHGLGRLQEARRVLELAPANAETLYWLAFVQSRQQDEAFRETLRRAEAASPRLVFPFRSESADVIQWAMGQGEGWRPKYYLALIYWSRNDMTKARTLLAECGNGPDFAPFYDLYSAGHSEARRTRDHRSAVN